MNSFYVFSMFNTIPMQFDRNKVPENKAQEICQETVSGILDYDMRFYREADADRYVNRLLEAANMGYGYAWYLLGWCHDEMPGPFGRMAPVKNAYEGAVRYYQEAINSGEAAKAGITEAMLELTMIYRDDIYTYGKNEDLISLEGMMDESQAQYWLSRALRQAELSGSRWIERIKKEYEMSSSRRPNM